jgi:hypothetical protein
MQIIKTGDSHEKLNKKLTKLNKTLVKYGYEPAVITSEKTIYVVAEDNNTEVVNPEIVLPTMKFRAYEWAINIPVNKVGQDGTEFIGYLEFGSEAAGNKVIPAFDSEDPCASQYDDLLLELARSRKNNCDHCNKIRTRNKLFVFKKGGEMHTIGSTCAQEWYGIEIEGFLNAWKGICGMTDEDEREYRNKAWAKALYVSEILLYCMASIDRQGFVGSKFFNSTVSDANMCYNWNHIPECRKGNQEPETLGHLRQYREKDFSGMITRMSEWYQNYQPLTLFDHNLRSGVLDLTLTAGQAPWAIIKWMDCEKLSYRNGMVIDSPAEARAKISIVETPNKYVAPVGEKVSIDGQVTFTRAFDTDFGVSYLIKVATVEGEITWFSSNNNFENCNINDLVYGTWIHIAGKVKKHDSYKESAQTVLTRCKLNMTEVK